MDKMYKAYRSMCTDEEIVLFLTRDEEGAMFAAFDYGVKRLDKNSMKLIQSIIDKIKEEVWPDE